MLLYPSNRKAWFAMRARLIRAGKWRFREKQPDAHFIVDLDQEDPQQEETSAASTGPAGISTLSKTRRPLMERRKVSKLGSDVEPDDTDSEEHVQPMIYLFIIKTYTEYNKHIKRQDILASVAKRKRIATVVDLTSSDDLFDTCHSPRNIIVEIRIPSTRQSLAILFAVDRYCGNRQEVWWAKNDPEIRLDIRRLFCVQSQPDIDHFVQYVLDNWATEEEIQERRRDLAAVNAPPTHLDWLPEALAGVRE